MRKSYLYGTTSGNIIKTTIFVFLILMATACQPGKDERRILQTRNESNRAFKAQNIENITTYLTDDIAITTGSGVLIHGKDSLKNYLTVLYAKSPGLYFVRETATVKINTAGDRAWETGVWTGLQPGTPDRNVAGGSYSAMWIKKDGLWKLRSELFVQLR